MTPADRDQQTAEQLYRRLVKSKEAPLLERFIYPSHKPVIVKAIAAALQQAREEGPREAKEE